MKNETYLNHSLYLKLSSVLWKNKNFIIFFVSDDAWWGQGVYFANDASYSVRDFLTRPGAGGTSQERNIYLCLVLTGVSSKGLKDKSKDDLLRYLPLRQDDTMLPYDSNTDNLNVPIEYVIFNDNQAYPLYRIKFTLT